MCIPKISMIMPVWNGEKYLAGAIDSILAQTWTDFEFLIIDDGSKDRSPEIIETYANKDSRIRIIRLEHEGIVIALNRGVAESRAEWIARMDCDDIAHPQRLECQLTALQSSGSDLCHTNIRVFGDESLINRPGRFIRSQALLALKLCFSSPIVHPTVMFRRELFLKLGGYLPAERHAEDYGLWGKFMTHGKIIGISEPLLNYRVHTESISKQKSATQKSISDQISLRHCKEFMKLDESNALLAFAALSTPAKNLPITEWIWFIQNCLPKLERKSLEMFAWVISRTARIIFSK